MKKNIMVLIYTLLISTMVMGQKSIQPSDIEVHTQMTILRVASRDVDNFETQMQALAELSKKVHLEEKYDWLTYKSGPGAYLLVNFSNSISDVLTLESYKNAFYKKGVGKEYDTVIGNLKQFNISVERNYIKQMLLPWSTVNEIFVSEFPLSTMIEYEVPIDKMEVFGKAMRELAALLKKTKYPYPLESNRGSLGAYGTMTHVWFYDDRNDFQEEKSLLNWMEENGQKEVFQSIMEIIETNSNSKKEYHFDYQKALSY